MPDPAIDPTATVEDELAAARETIRRQQQALGRFLLEKHEPVAIIGAGLRFPGGNTTLDGFTEFLRAGRSGIGPLPRDRWDVDAFTSGDPSAPGAIRTEGGGFLDRIDEFDAQFFAISPKQAPYVDPQQRLLLETAWEALENANVDPSALRHGNGAVYIGASPVDFVLELAALADEDLDGNLATGMGAYSLSGRLSYFLGWRGPSLTTDTACASSLTALHLAVGALRRGETDIALCGAVNALHHPRTFAILSQGQMLAPDGHCKTFDEAADGYARAEGCGVLVLKRLTDARRAGDTVLALVRGTAIGQDGESAGLTAPNGTAQEGVMRAALANARLEPADIQYVEAHGTGTPLGDPIEMGSVNGVFGPSRQAGDPLTIGSLKANLGHMEPAAGVGAIIKVLLQMRAGEFFPHLMDTPSGRIPWDAYPVTVPTEPRPWNAAPRRATVNGFGVAGAIGVAVLEQPPSLPAPAAPGPQAEGGGQVFTLSAKSAAALRLQVERFRSYLDGHPDVALADICHTRAVGRSHFRHRVAGVVRDREELAALLDQALERPGGTGEDVFRKVAMLFTGSGSQYVGMGHALYRRFPVFREHVDACDRLFTAHLGRSIADIMFGRAPDAEAALAQTVHTHAALFTLEYALAKLWLSWGVRPGVLIGHSVGEVAAATVAGLFSLPDGVMFLAERARLIQSVPLPGGMAAVSAPAADVAPLLAPWADLAIAAVNSPGQCVVSGGAGSLAEAVAALRERGMDVTPLQVSAGFHSPLMAGISEDLRAALAKVRFGEPTISIVSNLTGAVASPREMATADYWVRHLNEPVDFAAGVRAVDERGRHVFLEVGPSAALTSLARRCLPGDRHRWLSCLHPDDPAGANLNRALAGVYTAGLAVSWPAVYAGRPGRPVPLPAYAFDRTSYRLPWRDTTTAASTRSGAATGHRLLGRELASEPRPVPDVVVGGREGDGGSAGGPVLNGGPVTSAAGNGHSAAGADDGRAAARWDGGAEANAAGREFSSRISAADPGYLADHTLNGRVFVPAAAYVEMLLELADAVHGETTRPIEDVRLHEALFLTTEPVELRTRARPAAGGRLAVEIVSRVPGPDGVADRPHLTAVLGARDGSGAALTGPGREVLRLAAEAGAPDQVLGAADVYSAYARAGLDYGPQFSRMETVARHGADLTVGRMRGGDVLAAEHLPPPLMDGATHGLAALVDDGHDYVATRIARVRVFRKPRAARLNTVMRLTWAHPEPGTAPAPAADVADSTGGAAPAAAEDVAFTVDALLMEGGEPIMELVGMGFKRLARRPAEGTAARVRRACGSGARSLQPQKLDLTALAAAPPPARRAAVRDLVRDAVARLLSIQDATAVDSHATFLELGVDSLVAVQLRNVLETALGMRLASSVVFDHPSPNQLAEFLDHHLTPEPAAVPANA
ncbi:beta-ketoacyl synthase N-terminal-like domain-containing protein [Sphaerisporangium sp. TRM90804]|uniref:type I polyketide synthase n=1 Tax=Sphaerisporangium sp. TRM90804 TaxID=3031113 RepID=UPI00244D611C|nr:beta-ketoacyl synthase N-terminal-like domain-containing protein [Sphaerisporangium sp. TRM90804]MDH2428355.1 beta-ketoacyl synthase N-terminal-like domain-containing protein [Sphaerisporangium sp. TRM90804]